MKGLLRGVVLSFCLACTAVVQADDPQLHGFITQGWFKTDDNNYFGPSSRAAGSWQFDEFGVNPSWKVNDNVRLSALFLMRQAGGTDNNALRVDHAVADFSFSPTSDSTAGLLAGRWKIPFGFYNETRDVAETRPSILLPQSIYFDQARKYLINADGVQGYVNFTGADSSFTHIAVLAGHENGVDNPETETYFLGADWPGHLSNGNAYALRVTHDRNGGRTRLAAFIATVPHDVDYNPAPVDYLKRGTTRVDAAWLSAHQDIGHRWGVTAEAFLPKLTYTGYGPFLPDQIVYPIGYYAELQFRPAAKWEMFVRRDISYINRNDKGGTKTSALTGRPAYSYFAKDNTVGARYHLTSKLSLSGELHSVNGTSWLPIEDNASYTNTSQYWHLLAFQLSYTW